MPVDWVTSARRTRSWDPLLALFLDDVTLEQQEYEDEAAADDPAIMAALEAAREREADRTKTHGARLQRFNLTAWVSGRRPRKNAIDWFAELRAMQKPVIS